MIYLHQNYAPGTFLSCIVKLRILIHTFFSAASVLCDIREVFFSLTVPFCHTERGERRRRKKEEEKEEDGGKEEENDDDDDGGIDDDE